MADARLEFQRVDGALALRLAGSWTIEGPWPNAGEVVQELDRATARSVRFDTRDLEQWDSALLVFVDRTLAQCKTRSVEVDLAGLPAGVQRLVALEVASAVRRDEEAPVDTTLPTRVGQTALEVWRGVVEFVTFAGEATIALGRALLLRASLRRSDLWVQIQEAGAEALPIVTLISVLVGLILAFVGAVQLQRFGADLYVADLVAIAVVREMGSMMAGIIMAGRTGAAYAAQLGTMRVTEEIDALTTFGIRPMEFLVLPRLIALCVMMPLLTLYADVLGILGGAIVGVSMLDITPRLYFDETLTAFTLNDVLLGVAKGALYGVLVAVAGCMRGMQSGRSAAAVGEAATRAVVTGIVAIIVADGLMAVLCNILGI